MKATLVMVGDEGAWFSAGGMRILRVATPEELANRLAILALGGIEPDTYPGDLPGYYPGTLLKGLQIEKRRLRGKI